MFVWVFRLHGVLTYVLCHTISWSVVAAIFFFFLFKQKTAYEMRISDWSSDVCSSDLHRFEPRHQRCVVGVAALDPHALVVGQQRSEERRVGKECVSTCRSRWSTYK